MIPHHHSTHSTKPNTTPIIKTPHPNETQDIQGSFPAPPVAAADPHTALALPPAPPAAASAADSDPLAAEALDLNEDDRRYWFLGWPACGDQLGPLIRMSKIYPFCTVAMVDHTSFDCPEKLRPKKDEGVPFFAIAYGKDHEMEGPEPLPTTEQIDRLGDYHGSKDPVWAQDISIRKGSDLYSLDDEEELDLSLKLYTA
ncbi:hypothetical protein DFH07DRAFT_768877 [Mycena maculata]|uniref:Uncharacterized protein n=1 Tax=Mycena maculata TaxID=230809 RepID=A0AAD7JQX9_9AGAR|nr:hypothetical protein DFH07DRAFT_768877 [Mycena maculata]